MKIRRVKPSGTVLIAVVALVIGLEAPAMAHQVNVIAHKINGSTIANGSIPGNRLKANGVTGKQIKESTLSTVPNASKLGGKPSAVYALKAAATRSGLVSIPSDGAVHVLFKHYPLTWEGSCAVNGSGLTLTLTVKALEDVVFSQGSTNATQIASGTPFEVDSGTSGTAWQTVTDYTVTGTNHKGSQGLYTAGIHLAGDPCALSVTAG